MIDFEQVRDQLQQRLELGIENFTSGLRGLDALAVNE